MKADIAIYFVPVGGSCLSIVVLTTSLMEALAFLFQFKTKDTQMVYYILC